METLLMVAVVLTALAIIAQAGILIAMYLMSRRLATKAETLMNESQKLMAPLETITSNLKSVSNDLTHTSKMAREQMLQVQGLVSETHQNVRNQIAEIRELVLDTVDEARTVVMKPVREYSAIASGIAEGVRTLFGRKQKAEPVLETPEIVATEIIIERQEPAA
jgi:predicted  nucleic acid-binding Zn-ribbon protein